MCLRLVVKVKQRMCDLSINEMFDELLGNTLNNMLLDNLGEAASSAVGSPTNNRQVLANLAVVEVSYGVIANRVELVPGAKMLQNFQYQLSTCKECV